MEAAKKSETVKNRVSVPQQQADRAHPAEPNPAPEVNTVKHRKLAKIADQTKSQYIHTRYQSSVLISHDNITDFLEHKKTPEKKSIAKRLSVKEPRPAANRTSFIAKPKAKNVLDQHEETK